MGQSEHIKKSIFSLGLSITFLGMGNTKGQIDCKFLFVVKLIFIIHFLRNVSVCCNNCFDSCK